MPTPEEVVEALNQQAAWLAALIEESTPVPLDQHPQLAEVNGRPVSVRRSRHGLIADLSDQNASGTVMVDDARYVIFIDENGDVQIAAAIGEARAFDFLVLHEYGHITHGDVFEDDPEGIMERTKAQRDNADRYANGYAAVRLVNEMTPDEELSKEYVQVVKVQNGWAGPGDEEYDELFETP